MEYLSGRDLFRVLSESSYELTESKCKVFASQILSALGRLLLPHKYPQSEKLI
jgi:serine/threonine protein kinase